MDNTILTLLEQIQKVEKEICNFHLVFAEMMKDEINAFDEHEMYAGVMKIMRKYAKDDKSMTVINEFFSAITGGASLEEIMSIAIEEAQDPSVASGLTVDDSCKIK